MATRTLLQSILDVGDILGVHEQGTLTGASTTALTAANYPWRTNRTDASSRKYEGTEVYLEAAAANVTPNPNGVAAYVASTGVFTPSNTYANAPGSTLVFDLFTRGVGSQMIRDAINESLRNAYFKTIVPLSLVTDADMDTSGTTNWTGADSTLSKVTNSNALRGTQSLRVLATAANGYAQSATLFVDPTNAPTWYVEVLTRADIGTARLIPYDVTNAANITTEDWTLRGWGRLFTMFALPATAEALAFRLRSVANADDTYWENVITFPIGATMFPLPSWITSAEQVLRVWSDVGATARYDWDTKSQHHWWRVEPDYSNPNQQYQLRLSPGVSGPVWIEASRQYSALSLDADTTFFDRELLALMASVKLLERLVRRPSSEDVTAWKQQLYGSGKNPGLKTQLSVRLSQRYRTDLVLAFAEPI